MTKYTTTAASPLRPPIVVVLGHVDHGKTTLLDRIRTSNVAASEHGGITQHIGAYQATVSPQAKPSSRASVASRGIPLEPKKEILPRQPAGQDDFPLEQRKITFIDTPGHEAFEKMRSRGARVADIAILVVAADDSVKPQTIESIQLVRAAGIPMIVAINKTDLPSANVEKVKRDLAKAEVQVEGYGGDVPFVSLSAKTGKGIGELLDLITLVAQMKGLTGDPQSHLEAVVIETRVDKGKGTVATLVIQKGSLDVGTPLFDGGEPVGKVRAMFDEKGRRVIQAVPGQPVEVLGFAKQPQIGSVISEKLPIEKVPPKISPQAQSSLPHPMPDFLKPIEEQEKETLSIVLKADTAGSLEAITSALNQKITVVGSGIGEISEADILLAKPSSAIVIGFNVKCPANVGKLATTEGVVCRTYRVIYELLDELTEVVSGLKEVLTRERELGRGQIIAEFPYEKLRVAGTKVLSGRLARGDTVNVVRDKEDIGKAKIKSMRVGKQDTTKVEAGSECGVLLDRKVDFQLGDAIIAVTTG